YVAILVVAMFVIWVYQWYQKAVQYDTVVDKNEKIIETLDRVIEYNAQDLQLAKDYTKELKAVEDSFRGYQQQLTDLSRELDLRSKPTQPNHQAPTVTQYKEVMVAWEAYCRVTSCP